MALTIAVTGASGFIGRLLVQRLVARGDTVRVLTRDRTRARELPPSVEVCVADLASGAEVPAAFLRGASVIYHLAGEINRPAAMRPLHVEGTRALIKRATAERISHWVQLSSVGVYGPVRSGDVDEDHALAPCGEYEITKAESDGLVRQATEEGAFGCTVLRPSIVFGPGMPNRSLYQLISMVARGMFVFVGPPGASANYIFVDNVVDALLACGTAVQVKSSTYILSDFRTMEEFVGCISTSLRKAGPRLRMPEKPVRWLARSLGRLPGFPLTDSRVDALTSRSRYLTHRIETELGYSHRISMETGIQQLVEFWLAGK